MKARVKETEQIFQVMGVLSNTADGYALDEVDLYCDESDNLVVGVSEDYWEKLKHQYAGMAMQALLNREIIDTLENVSNLSILFATALIEKLKNE